MLALGSLLEAAIQPSLSFPIQSLIINSLYVPPSLVPVHWRMCLLLSHDCHCWSMRRTWDLSKRGRQRQRPEARKILLRTPRILLSIYLYFAYPACFYFRWNSVDPSVSSWTERWALVLEMSAIFWWQRENVAVEVSFESRTAQMSSLLHIHMRFLSSVISVVLPTPSSAVLLKVLINMRIAKNMKSKGIYKCHLRDCVYTWTGELAMEQDYW